MKYGFITLDFRRFPLEFCFQAAARYGFDGIELWGGRPHAYITDMTEDYIRDIKGWEKRYDIEIPMYTPNILGGPYNLCSPMPRQREETLEFFRDSIRAAGELECPRVLVTADHPGYTAHRRECWRVLVENLQELCGVAAGFGVTLVIESLTPMESPMVTTADDCVDLLRDVDQPNLEAMLDVVPPVVAYEPFSAYFDKLGDKLCYIHICNTDGVTDAHLRLDRGVIPPTGMIELFKSRGYAGYVTLELYSENYRDPELLLAESARQLGAIEKELAL